MADKTGIAWTNGGSTWNPIRGCSIVSAGCVNCYAMKMAGRFSGPGQPYEGLVKHTSTGPKWNGKVNVIDTAMDQPSRWSRPRLIFVNSMSDLYHESLTDETIIRVFDEMERADWHIFQVLTKRTKRMMEFCQSVALTSGRKLSENPLPNVWLGTSIENEEAAEARARYLAKTPAVVRFWSAEPLIGGINWAKHLRDKETGKPTCEWVIFGGESQTGCRPLELTWIEQGIQACRDIGVTPFVKQLGEVWAKSVNAQSRSGEEPKEWPEAFNVREYPIDVLDWLFKANERTPAARKRTKKAGQSSGIFDLQD